MQTRVGMRGRKPETTREQQEKSQTRVGMRVRKPETTREKQEKPQTRVGMRWRKLGTTREKQEKRQTRVTPESLKLLHILNNRLYYDKMTLIVGFLTR